MDATGANRRPLVSAGLLLGVGMGGFVDGIVLHQLLQLHNMLSARRPKDSIANIQVNMVWDGLFHSFTWVMTAAGIALLFRAARRPDVPWSGRVLVGSMVAGWGLFNLVEGLFDHHLLQVDLFEHLMVLSVWDWLFLASGVVMIAAGWAIARWAPGVTRTAAD
jgi:uncharacterized membrane protein